MINSYPTIIFWSENVICFLCLLHIFKRHFRLDFLIETNNMTPGQSAPKGAVIYGSILFAI